MSKNEIFLERCQEEVMFISVSDRRLKEGRENGGGEKASEECGCFVQAMLKMEETENQQIKIDGDFIVSIV